MERLFVGSVREYSVSLLDQDAELARIKTHLFDKHLVSLTTALDAMCFGALQFVMSTVPNVRPIRAKALEMVSAVIKSTMATSPLTNATVAGHPIQHKPSIHYLLTPPFSLS
ncbi:hypothetical protein COLO4_19691 [Corchorus olitorius]|uniref:Uncharacterized protein n=1 Tax=Corchorus olitorius TaxID=93759 RepID=A0A1R3J3Y9_9ROSI|nr:hypothetical protein COLO4_19691 [Corchorus olitorius]